MNSDNSHVRPALSITGMTCDGCANAVRRALSRVAGVDLARGRGVVAGVARPEDLIAAVKAAGFGAELEPPQG